MQCSALFQCHNVQYNKVLCKNVHCSSVPCSAVQYSAVHWLALQCIGATERAQNLHCHYGTTKPSFITTHYLKTLPLYHTNELCHHTLPPHFTTTLYHHTLQTHFITTFYHHTKQPCHTTRVYHSTLPPHCTTVHSTAPLPFFNIDFRFYRFITKAPDPQILRLAVL